MINAIKKNHRKEYDESPDVICSAPGSIGMMGEHGHICTGQVLSFAIDKRLYISATVRSDNALCFYFANLDERKKISVNNLKFKKEDRWANYSKGVIDGLMRMGYKISGMNITILSAIPMGMGLSSSAALAVCTACAIRELFKLDISEAQLLQAAIGAKTNFMKLREGMCSVMISYYARENHISIIDTKSFKVQYISFLNETKSILLTNSKVKETLGDAEQSIIDAACLECIKALGIKNSRLEFHKINPEELSGSIEGLSERSRRICLHFIMENLRVSEFKEVLAKEDYEELRKILFRSHESLRDNLEISCPEIDWLVKRGMLIDGVYGTRMVGKGYGGCTLTLIENESIRDFEECLEEYERIFGFQPSVFSLNVGSGVQLHQL